MRIVRGFQAAVVALALASLAPPPAKASACAGEPLQNGAIGRNECIVLKNFRGASVSGPPQALVVVVHGDVSGGGPASYHFAVAQSLVETPDLASSLAVALVRPGYEDGAGNTSGGSHFGRSDSYTAANIDEIAGVVEKLKQAHRPQRVVMVGHSGGAAMSAVLLGRHPGLVDGAVLVACPCDIGYWRMANNWRPWTRSESPHRYADRVPPQTRVIALTGSGDTNTMPALARDYVKRLADRGLQARFVSIDGASHNSAFRSPEVVAAVVELATK